MIRIASPTRAFWRAAGVAVSTALLLAPIGPAHAQRMAEIEDEGPPSAEASPIGPARLAVVSLAHQHVTFYDANGASVRSPISSGQSGMDTPVGVYSILQKKEEHTSNIYDDARMPFMQRITWSGVALHAGALPGYPASHGCVRLPISFAERIFSKTRLGMRVVISRDDIAPAPIEHAALFQPRPAAPSAPSEPAEVMAESYEQPPVFMPDLTAWPARLKEQEELKAEAVKKAAAAKEAADAVEPLKEPVELILPRQKKLERSMKTAEATRKAAEKRLANAEKAVAAAKKPRAVTAAERARDNAKKALETAEAKLQPLVAEAERIAAELAPLKAELEAAEQKNTAAAAEALEAERKLFPVSVFVSLATQRLYVRQGHQPVTDMPIEIRDPDMPIGTHVFTALDYTSDGNTVRWNAVSIARAEDTYDEFAAFNRRRRAEARPVPQTDAAAAAAALERIVIPPEMREKLSAYVWPGASLIISDEPAHKKETNQATDFIVIVSGYPQGGIRKRPPPPPSYYYDAPLASFFGPPPNARGYGTYYYQPGRRTKKKPSLFSWW